MAKSLEISFGKLAPPKRGSVFALCGKGPALGPAAAALDESAGGTFKRAAKAAKFEAAARKVMQVLAPAASRHDRIVFVGLGEADKMTAHDWLRLGGVIAANLPRAGDAAVLLERPDGRPVSAEEAAAVALGLRLRVYAFDKYKAATDDDPKKPQKVRIGVGEPGKAAAAWQLEAAVADGVTLARDLVNEPANTLGPAAFAERLEALSALGIDVEVLDEKALARRKMGALLGVAQGSARPPRVVAMRYKGGKARDKPLALVGKGVVFDTGGISMKPASGMEDMKGDMGGAAAVAGAMHAIAARKAKANVVGIVGLVENMPDGNAQRPGDIVTSMAGKTIEVLNTDAEGRLVLADLLTLIQKTDKPAAIVDLATLTGAIIVALGHHHAGLFSNNDDLVAGLTEAAAATGEKVWRMPLGKEYDKMIDSKNADMKNIGGRWGGSITAAQFLKRFIENDTPWAHLDVAGTAMGSPSSDTNASWASGFGVRLLDSLVRARFETGAAPAKPAE